MGKIFRANASLLNWTKRQGMNDDRILDDDKKEIPESHFKKNVESDIILMIQLSAFHHRSDVCIIRSFLFCNEFIIANCPILRP